MLRNLKQLFGRGRQLLHRKKQSDDEGLRWLNPPEDPLDVGAWDRYWRQHIEHGIGPPLFDMFCDDRALVEVMNKRGMRSVLCAGNGISQEPAALAEAGFEVVALDFSEQAIEFARSFELPPEGFNFYCDPESRRPGGSVEFVVGDILDSSICPGPFDVIIERKTAQLFLANDLGAVMRVLASRLSQEGIFFSHCHDGAWRPSAEPRHFTERWFRKNGWAVWSEVLDPIHPGRVAWLLTTTG